MTQSQLNVSETPPISQEDLQNLAKNETDENGLILGKFKTQEDLINSYKELEGKLGAVEEETTEEAETEDTGIPEGYEDYYNEDGTVDYNSVNETYGETLGGIFKEAQIDPYKISAEFHKNKGEIPEDMYQSLLDAGLSKPAVDSYLTGRAKEMGYGEESDTEIPEPEVQAIRDMVGGDDSYFKMVDWAMENLPRQEILDFNAACDGNATAPQLKFMVQGLFTQYQNAMGKEPTLYSGRQAASGPNPFKSGEEVKMAMRDPRYGKDVAYTQNVYDRLDKSDVFTQGV